MQPNPIHKKGNYWFTYFLQEILQEIFKNNIFVLQSANPNLSALIYFYALQDLREFSNYVRCKATL